MVKELFELYATDEYSMKQIEVIFWDKGYRNLNGKKIAHSTMANMIANAKYKGYYVEIQGRTLFEEGWSEIDHDIVYKEAEDDEMLQDYSKLLNRLSGLADEMSSYFRRLKQQREEHL
jgi:ppGpp synthetase/RelA/SpoT-type nucleotidyltranferase